MNTYTPRWSAKNPETRANPADKTDKTGSVGFVCSLTGRFQKIVATELALGAQHLLRKGKFPPEVSPCAEFVQPHENEP